MPWRAGRLAALLPPVSKSCLIDSHSNFAAPEPSSGQAVAGTWLKNGKKHGMSNRSSAGTKDTKQKIKGEANEAHMFYAKSSSSPLLPSTVGECSLSFAALLTACRTVLSVSGQAGVEQVEKRFRHIHERSGRV